jgi:hypothetical protein
VHRTLVYQSIFNWSCSYLVVPSPPATKEIGAVGREIEARQGVCM